VLRGTGKYEIKSSGGRGLFFFPYEILIFFLFFFRFHFFQPKFDTPFPSFFFLQKMGGTHKKSMEERKVYADKLKAAKDEVKNGGKLLTVAKKYGLARNALRYHVESSTLDFADYTGGRKASMSHSVEGFLAAWVDEMVERGFAVNCEMVIKKATKLSPELKGSFKLLQVCPLFKLYFGMLAYVICTIGIEISESWRIRGPQD